MHFFKHLRYRWLSDIRIIDAEEGLHYERLGQHGWQAVEAESLSGITSFSTIALLISDAKCSFRCREFPVDMVKAKDLDEAIALDIPQWSPFDGDISSLSFFERIGDVWRVAVWLWPRDEEQRLLAKLPASFHCTHLLPQMAWFAARAQAGSPQLLIHSAADNGSSSATYALLSSAGIPFALARVEYEKAARRYWRALGSQAEAVAHVSFCSLTSSSLTSSSVASTAMATSSEQPTPWVPDQLELIKSDWSVSRHSLFARARLKGVRDWSDPLSWRKQLLAALSLLVIWVTADASVLVQRMSQINQQLSSVEQGAHAVLGYREQVTKYQAYLQHYADLKVLQYQHEWLLAELSEKIPKDIWLSILQSGDGWVDIRGQGKNVIRLVVLLEKIKGVKHAMLLNDIRPNARTGMEAFQLRLVLAHIIHESP